MPKKEPSGKSRGSAIVPIGSITISPAPLTQTVYVPVGMHQCPRCGYRR